MTRWVEVNDRVGDEVNDKKVQAYGECRKRVSADR